VPTPSALAVLRIPTPLAKWLRIRSTTSVLAGRRPSRFPWLRARVRTAFDPLGDCGALELGEHAHHLEHCFPRQGAGVEPLLVEMEIDTFGNEVRRGTRANPVVSAAPTRQ